MAKIFLSYAREDRRLIEPLAHLLESAGHSVWWDRRIAGGADFSSEIARALAAAEIVIVAWSTVSVTSHWVKDEAAEGRERERLVPILLDPTAPPLGFRQIQAVDLSGWDGRGRPPVLDELLHAIDLIAARNPASAPAPVHVPLAASRAHAGDRAPAGRPLALALVGGLLVLALAVGAYFFLQRSELEPTVQVEPAPAVAARTGASPAAAGDPDIDGRWRISWTMETTAYRGVIEATGGRARVDLEVTTSVGPQSVRQDCTVAGSGPIRIACHNAEVVSGPPGYMPDSFTFERTGPDTLSGTVSDPLGLVSHPVTARRE